MNNIMTIVKKEFKDILRDRKTLLMTFVIPIIIMPLLFTFIFSSVSDLASPSEDNKYKIVLETLRGELEDGKLTPEERKRITDDMISVAEKIDNVNDKHHIFVKDIITKVGGTVAGVLLVGVAILGAIGNDKNNKS